MRHRASQQLGAGRGDLEKLAALGAMDGLSRPRAARDAAAAGRAV